MFGLRLDRMMWIVFVIILGTFSFQVQSFGFDEKEDNNIPDRLIVMAPEYPGVVISPDGTTLTF